MGNVESRPEQETIKQEPNDFEGKVIVFEHLEYREKEGVKRGGARRSLALAPVQEGRIGPRFLIDVQLGANPKVDQDSLDEFTSYYGTDFTAVDFKGYSFLGLKPDYEAIEEDEDVGSSGWTQYRSLSHSPQLGEILLNSGYELNNVELRNDVIQQEQLA